MAERELLAQELAEQELAEQELAGPAQPGADLGRPGAGVAEQSLAVPGLAEQSLAVPGLASGLAAAIERLIGLFRSLSPANGLSLTAAATLATLERSGPCRLTWLAVQEGVTQPAMTQLIGRLQDAGLVDRVDRKSVV